MEGGEWPAARPMGVKCGAEAAKIVVCEPYYSFS